jgi:hypothetical protein
MKGEGIIGQNCMVNDNVALLKGAGKYFFSLNINPTVAGDFSNEKSAMIANPKINILREQWSTNSNFYHFTIKKPIEYNPYVDSDSTLYKMKLVSPIKYRAYII